MGLLVVLELHSGTFDFHATVQGQLNEVKVTVIAVLTDQTVSLSIQERWRVTVKRVFVENCRVCKNGFVENAHGFVCAKIKEVLTSHFELSQA